MEGLRIGSWIFGFCVAAAACCIAEAGEIRLSGRVTDPNGLPVSGAKVVLTAPNQVRFEAESDPTGAYSLTLPDAGSYAVSADREGYYVYKLDALAIQASPFELGITLAGTHEMATSLEVSTERGTFDMERSVPETTLSSRTLFDIPFPNQNSLRSGLRMLPGVVQDGRGGIHLHGAAEEQTHHSLEGFQLNDPLTGKLEARLSLEAVESVDASPGQPGAEFGRGTGGSLALHARKGGDTLRYSATNFIPGFGTQRGPHLDNWTPRGHISGPWKRGRAWFFNSLELQYVNNIVVDLPRGQDRSGTYRANNLFHNQINLTPSNVLTAGFLLNYWFAPRNGLTALNPIETTIDRRYRQWIAYFKNQKSFARGALIEAGYSFHRSFNRENPQGDAPYIVSELGRSGNYYAFSNRQASRDQILINSYLPSVQRHGMHQLKAGADLLRVGYNQDVRRTSIAFSRTNGTPLRSVAYFGSGALQQGNYEASAYLQDAWRPRENLLIDLGLRLQWNQIISAWNASPRMGFAWMPQGSPSTRISGGFARVFDYVNLRTFVRPQDQFTASTYFDGADAGVPLFSIFRPPAGRLRSPHALTWNLGVERHLPRRITARLQWLQRSGYSGFTYRNSLPAPQPVSDLVDLPGAPLFDSIFLLTNDRRDTYGSVELTVQQPLFADYEWMASYTRSRARSNGVIDTNVDEPLIINNNRGPLPWDAPNRFVSWGFLPTFWKNWSIAYLAEWRSGFPFFVQDERGQVIGSPGSRRFPAFFECNLFVERKVILRGYRVGLRGGFVNITGHANPNVVNNVVGSPNYLQMFGGQRRAFNFRLRFLGKV